MKPSDFVHLHTHSTYSLLEALPSPEEIVERTKELGQHAVGLADKGHVYGLIEFYKAAKDAGVETSLDYAIFQDHGYKGLYGGLGAKDIHARKGLKKSQKILDHMGSTELAANLFRATQAEEKLKRDNVSSKQRANRTHYEVGQKVRQTINDLGGTMPESLPKPEQSVKQVESAKKKLEKKK